MANIKIGQKFDWDTDALPAYIDENSDVLYTRLVNQSKSVRLMQTVEGIKGTQALQLLDSTIVWQNGASCGFNPGGTDALSQKTITVADIKVEKEFCNKDLVGFWAQRKLKPGAGAELAELPFEETIMNELLLQNQKKIEYAIWQGDTNSMNPDLNRFDGFEKQLSNLAGVINLNTGNVAAITDNNALAVFRAAFEAMGSTLTQDERFAMYTSWANVQHLISNLITLNLYNYNPGALQGGVMMDEYVIIPGTRCKVWYVEGLTGSDNIYAGLAGGMGEFIVGTDTEGDFTKIESGYDARLQSLWFRLQFRLGVTFPFANQIGVFAPSVS